jgi:antitoxin component YwqK of YwqJK toxin-antitoxin module
MNIYHFLFPLLIFHFSLFSITQDQASLLSLLKKREPNHKIKTEEVFSDQSPKVAVFYAPRKNKESEPVKKMEFFQGGDVKYEMDICEVKEGSEGEKIWKSTKVPHGVRVDFYGKGNIAKIALYKEGLLHGPVKIFHANGQLKSSLLYQDNKPTGKYVVFDEEGRKKVEGKFASGKLVGDYILCKGKN